MEKVSSKIQIFQTEPEINFPPYQRFLNEVKNYTQNLDNHLAHTFNDQNKSIKRKRKELQKQLEDLREKHFNQRKRIRQMEEYFVNNCENVLKNDIAKWEQNQLFFNKMFSHYHYEVEIQTLINQNHRQKLKILRQQLKQEMKQGLKSVVSQQLQIKHLSKSKNFRSKNSISSKSHSKMGKVNTEASQILHLSDFNQISVRKHLKSHTQMDQTQIDKLPCTSQKIIRIKTQVALPSLKKSSLIDSDRTRIDDFNFLKPIGTIKKSSKQFSSLPQIIKFLKEYHRTVQSQKMQVDWFQKVFFNNRNFDRIIGHLEEQYQLVSGKRKINEPCNKVKDLVAKNLFRLKTQSTVDTTVHSITKKKSRVFHTNEKKPGSQRVIK